jgi:hypothetical protein
VFRPRYTVLVGLLLLLFCTTISKATDITWTPNEEAEAPLPLSNNQRQQLLQLEDVIMKSPDPTATLNQAAEANGMDPMDLLDLLERNRSGLEEGGAIPAAGNGNAPSRQRNIWKVVTSMGVVIAQAASKNPKAFSLIATSLLLVTYIAISAPRTGLVMSSHRGLLSNGASTVWSPPTQYVDHLLESPRFLNREVSFSSKRAWKVLNPLLDDEDGSVWHKLPKKIKADLQQAASSQVTILTSDFLEASDEDNDEDEDNENDETEQLLDLCFEQASNVLNSLQLTEFARPLNSLRLISQKDDPKEHAVLVVKSMGDWGRYGLLPLKVVHQRNDNDDVMSLTLGTLKRSHFDGQIHVEVKKKGNNLVVRVNLLVPRKGQKVTRKIAMSIVEGISQSVALSVKTRTKQSLARRSQSSRFSGSAKSRAAERRHMRYAKVKAMEEMSEDRRRRWQRQNPNAGRYTPSGDRMRSPKNC